jgi:ArsR family transcriptional regulator
MSNYRTDEVEPLAKMFKALSNPHRLRIFLNLLSTCGAEIGCEATKEAVRSCVGDLGKDLGLAASTVSHHLKELRQVGLMKVERRGQKVECWISQERIRELADFFDEARGTAIRSAARTLCEESTDEARGSRRSYAPEPAGC